MRREVTAVAAALTMLVPVAAAEAQQRFCGPGERSCTRVVVPLDRTGTVPGEVSLYVERTRPRRPSGAPLFLLAGGPGQSATAAFDRDSTKALLGRVGQRREIVIVDQRGTGGSGVIRCRGAETLEAKRAIDACARHLGPKATLYSTRDSVEDLETVRRELGLPRIALFGVSYGTKVALAYAERYPQRVERVVLDSVVDPLGPSAFSLDTLQAVPRVIRSLCGRACRGFTRDPVRDLARLSARLERRAQRGYVVGPRGRRRRALLTQSDLLGILVASDLDPASRGELPGAVKAAVEGDPIPMLRLKRRALEDEAGGESDPRFFSPGGYLATRCSEGPWPWSAGASPAERLRQAKTQLAGFSPSAFGPFGRGAALALAPELEGCAAWPQSGGDALGADPLPDVPMLLLSGELDLRTPVAGADRVRSRVPSARVLNVPATGHDASGSDPTRCTRTAVRRFLEGAEPPRRCARPKALPIIPPPPLSLRDLEPVRGVPGRRGRALAAVGATVRDAETEIFASLLEIFGELFGLTEGDAARLTTAGGLRGGSLRVTRRGVVLRRLTYVPGVRISGRLRELAGDGTVRVSGPATPDGVLRIRGRRITGHLGGRPVRARLGIHVDVDRLELLLAQASRRLVAPGAP